MPRVRGFVHSAMGNRLAGQHGHGYGVHMSSIRFEWDDRKSRENKRKLKVSFEEAQTVFLDENAIRR